MHSYAVTLMELGKTDSAIHVMETVVALRSKVQGEHHSSAQCSKEWLEQWQISMTESDDVLATAAATNSNESQSDDHKKML